MGILTSLTEIETGLGLSWYFDKVVNGPYLPNKYFPHECAIHASILRDSSFLKKHIRKWIADTIPDTVIYTHLDLMYFYAPPGDRYSNNGWQVNHGYASFFFENAESAVMFKLRFNEFITAVKMMYDDDYLPAHRDSKDWDKPRVNQTYEDYLIERAKWNR